MNFLTELSFRSLTFRFSCPPFTDGELCTAGRAAERKTGKGECFGKVAYGCRQRAWEHRASASSQHSPGVLLHIRPNTRVIMLGETFSCISMGKFLERPKDGQLKYKHCLPHSNPSHYLKKVYFTFCCLIMYENHSASSKSHIFESLAKNVFHRRRETVLRRRWMLFKVI